MTIDPSRGAEDTNDPERGASAALALPNAANPSPDAAPSGHSNSRTIVLSSAAPVHTDHPLRVWDRTCPACRAEDGAPYPNAAAADSTTTETPAGPRTNNPALPSAAPAPGLGEPVWNDNDILEVLSFSGLIDHGKEHGANIVNGMPWSFDYKGRAVTHENDRCYLIGHGAETLRFEPGNVLITPGWVVLVPKTWLNSMEYNLTLSNKNARSFHERALAAESALAAEKERVTFWKKQAEEERTQAAETIGKMEQYCQLLERGLSAHEARETVWPDVSSPQGEKGEDWKLVPLNPTAEMRTDGGRRLLSFQDGSTDDSFSGLQWAAVRNEAERVWRSMWLSAPAKEEK